MKKKKRTNPADLTGRNNRARKKEVAEIWTALHLITLKIIGLEKRIDKKKK